MSSFRVVVDGQETHATEGRTVAAVLLATGRTSWRTTRGRGSPRGLFCGIGVCHDCLVVVNGVPDVRACQREITDGDVISTQHGAVLPAHPPDTNEADEGAPGAGACASRGRAPGTGDAGGGPSGGTSGAGDRGGGASRGSTSGGGAA